MALARDIQSLEDLRARKQQLQEELQISRQALEENLDDILTKRSFRQLVVGTAMSWLTAYSSRLFRKSRSEAQAFGASNQQASIAGYLPLIRRVLNYLLDYAERRFTRPRAASAGSRQNAKPGRRKEQPAP